MTIKHYIAGEWTAGQSSQTTDVINPASGEVIAKCPLGNTQDVDAAVQAAQSAFDSWKGVPAIERVQPLFKLKTLVEQNVDVLAKLVTEENGKIFPEAQASVRRGLQMIETACGIPSLMMGEFSGDIARGIDSYAVREPMGVFAVIAPFNFPAMVPLWFWPFGVAAGNTYVIKPSERVPLTQTKMCELIEQAGFPKGVVNMVHGGKESVEALCSHPKVKGVSFVGSTPVARRIYQMCGDTGKRVQALGGAKNVMVVLPDATLERSCATAFESIVGCAGERCLAGSVVLSVGEQTASQIEKQMVQLAQSVNVGDGLDSKSQMGPIISQASKDRIKSLIQSAVDEGAKLLVDGREGVDHLPGYFLKPTVLSGVTPKMKIAQEEVFGPVICLGTVPSLDEAISWINDSPFGNTTTLFTTNGGAARKFSNEVHPSMIGINIGVPAPMAFFSFGGSKDSFFGDIKAHGARSVDFFTDTKTVIQRWESESSIW